MASDATSEDSWIGGANSSVLVGDFDPRLARSRFEMTDSRFQQEACCSARMDSSARSPYTLRRDSIHQVLIGESLSRKLFGCACAEPPHPGPLPDGARATA